MVIPLIDLKAQYLTIKTEIDQAIQGVIDTTSFIGGQQLADFEQAFAAYCEAGHCVGAASGTAALHLALCAAGVQPGDEVLTVSYTFIATAEVAKLCGATVRFVEIDPVTYCMDPAALEAAIGPRTRVVIPVHLYGHPAPMDAILRVAAARGVAVIEDAAQSHGARCHGRRVGSIAPIATFSFYPGKNLGAYGDAGALTLADAATAKRISSLGNHGRSLHYKYEVEGFNYRLDTLQAAILRVKLRHLDAWNARRRQIAARYDELLRDVEEIVIPRTAPGYEHVYHLYVIQTPDRDGATQYLRDHGVLAQQHYPIPLHLQPAYAYLGVRPGSFPVTEALAERCVSLPIYPEMNEEQIGYVAETVKGALVRT
jgi:dTDP-4-amino-4,6-dideoxygalactose transaminase